MKGVATTALLCLLSTQAFAESASDCKYCVKQRDREGNYYSCEQASNDGYHSETPYHYCSDGDEYRDQEGNLSRECATFSACATPLTLHNGRKMFYVSARWSCPQGMTYADHQLFA